MAVYLVREKGLSLWTTWSTAYAGGRSVQRALEASNSDRVLEKCGFLSRVGFIIFVGGHVAVCLVTDGRCLTSSLAVSVVLWNLEQALIWALPVSRGSCTEAQ